MGVFTKSGSRLDYVQPKVSVFRLKFETSLLTASSTGSKPDYGKPITDSDDDGWEDLT